MSMLTKGLPHLDTVISALTPAYRAEVPFRCQSARDNGTRTFTEAARDRDCRWRLVPGVGPSKPKNAGMVAAFRSRYLLDIYIEVTTTPDVAQLVGAELAVGIMTDATGADWRGTPSVTTLLAVAVEEDVPVEFTDVVTSDGSVIAVITSVPFNILHGSC